MAEPQQTIEGSVTITGSIEVLGDVQNPAIQSAVTKIETIAGEVQYVRTAVDEQTLAYSMDGVITQAEKADIRNTWVAIEGEYPAIIQRATEKGISAGTIDNYANAYAHMRGYLFGEPGILLEMAAASAVEPHSYGQALIQYITTKEEVLRQIDRKNITSNFETRYKRSASVPETPTGNDPAGWTLEIPTGTDPIWMSGAMKNADGTIAGEWYPPFRFTNAATLAGFLSNDRHTIPTDMNGDQGNYTGAESKLIIYEGSQDKSSEFTMGYTPSTGVTVDAAYFAATKIVRVTAMTVDAGYVDLQGERLGTTIVKRFALTKARQGEQAPVYSMGVSTTVCLVKPDGTRNPGAIQFNATKQVGLSAPQAYEGLFKFYVDDILWFTSPTPQSEYNWAGFEPLYPDAALFPSDTLYPRPVFTGQTALKTMRVELWDASGAVELDAQSVIFIADWENYKDDMLATVPDFVPQYLGRFEQAMPAIYRKGDTWLVYGTTDTPYQRGLYFFDGVAAPYRVTDADGTKSKLIAEALPDILWATKNGYGTTNLYGAVTYIENLVTNAIFTERIQIGQGNVTGLGAALDGKEAAGAAAAAQAAAQAHADAKAELARVTAEAYADGIVSAEEARAIADATAKANAAQAAAEATAAGLASAAQATAELAAKNSLAYKLGYADWAAMEAGARLGSTLIEGGYISTGLIDVEALLAREVVLKNGGSIVSENYDSENGFNISSDGTVEIRNGTFRGTIEAEGGTFKGYLDTASLYTAPGNDNVYGPHYYANNSSQARNIYRDVVLNGGGPEGYYRLLDHDLPSNYAYAQITTRSGRTEKWILFVPIWYYWRWWEVRYYDVYYNLLEYTGTYVRGPDLGTSSISVASTATPNNWDFSRAINASFTRGGDQLFFKNLPITDQGLSVGRAWVDSNGFVRVKR